MHISNEVKVCPEEFKNCPILKNWTFLDSARQSDSGKVLVDFFKLKLVGFDYFIKCTWYIAHNSKTVNDVFLFFLWMSNR
jgi:hypothetical protein